MSDLKVCVLCGSTQIRRVPYLGRINNYHVVCAREKVGQRGRISATGCENRKSLEFEQATKRKSCNFIAWSYELWCSLTLVPFFFPLTKSASASDSASLLVADRTVYFRLYILIQWWSAPHSQKAACFSPNLSASLAACNFSQWVVLARLQLLQLPATVQ